MLSTQLSRCRALILSGIVLASGSAAGQTGTTLLAKEDFLIRLQRPVADGFAFLNDVEIERFFNKARCECQERVRILVEMSPSGAAKRSLIDDGTVQLLVGGTECLAETAAARMGAMCLPLGDPIRLADLATRQQAIEITVDKLFFRPGATGSGCVAELTQTLWLSIDENLDQTPELLGAQAPTLGLKLDGRPPLAPVGLEVLAGHEALRVRWKDPQERIADFEGFLVFCARGGELPVFADSGFDDQYQFCPTAPAPGSAPPPSGGGSAESGTPVPVPDPLRRLDPAFLCSDLLTSQTETRISILENGIPYVVGVAAVDRRGNASPVESAVLQQPIPTVDFFRGYRAAGGQADGGCTMATGSPPSAGAWVLALAWLFARRRRGRRT